MKDFIKRFNQRKNSRVFNSFHKLKYTLKSKRKECNNMKEHKKNTFIILKRDKAKK